MNALDIKYATYANALPPRPIRMKVGGWAGTPDGMVDGSEPQPWHCQPFVEGSVYGLELIYPFETPCDVVNNGGAVHFEWDYLKEPGGILTGGEFLTATPKDRPATYLFNTRLDIQAPPGYVIRSEPHPRYFTDTTGTVPLAFIGHVQTEWYPRKLFLVFKSPPPGGRHLFRKGEPYAQILFVPQRVSYRVTAMPPEEEAQRRELEQAMDAARSHIADNVWHNPDGSEFNNHYKVMARAFADSGQDGVRRAIDEGVARMRASMPQDMPLAECVRMADELVAKQKFEEARTLYKHVLERDPNNAPALSGLGVCVGCTGAPVSGVELMRQAIALQPNVPKFHANLGEMLLLMNRYADAVSAYRTAMRLNPGDAALMSHVGLLTARLGDLAEGLRLCRTAVATDPRCAVAHYRAGLILAQLGQGEQARAAYHAALAADPSFEPARRALSTLAPSPANPSRG